MSFTMENPQIDNGPTESTKEDERVAPDGGLAAWLCVLGGWCCQFCSFGLLNACGIFQLYYETEILSDHSSSSLTWIITLQIFLMFVLGPIVGVLVEVVGPRPLIAPASILAVLALGMLSLCKQYWQVMLAQGIAFGFAAAVLFLPPMVCVGQWFSTRRGLATGIVASGSSIGGIIFPIVVSRLIQQHGFPAAVRWTALLEGCLLAIASVCVKAPFQPKGRAQRKSAGVGVFKSVPWIIFSIGCFLVMWGLFAPFDYLPLMGQSIGMSENMATYLISITNAGSVIGRVLPGFLSDKVGQLNIMSLVGLFSGLSILIFWLPLEQYPSPAGLVVFSAVFGLLSGGFVSLMTPCVVALCDGNVEELGPKLGAFLLVIAFGALTGLPIQGAIKDSESDDSFKGLIIFAGVVMTLGGVFVVVVRILKGGFKFAKV